MQLTFGQYVKEQRTKQPPVVKADLTGKTVIVTGANTGLGFEAAKHFAKMNAGRIILACRSQSRGQAAIEKLKAETGYAAAELWILDLADFASVKQFADKFDQDGGRLDIVVSNAAVRKTKYEATKDGWESSLQINDLSTPLLCLLLLPHMLRTAKEHSVVPRLVVVGSEVHYWTGIPKSALASGKILETLGSKECCTRSYMRFSYMVTKLLNVLFVRALNARLTPTTPLIVNTVNPGLCASELNRDLRGPMSLIVGVLVKTLSFTSEEGSRRLVHAAVGNPENPDKLRGQYLNQCHVDEPSDWVISAEGRKTQDQIWEELVVILGKVDPRVSTIAEKYLVQPALA